MSAVLLESLVLQATSGLRFIDAWSGQPIIDGLRCTLYRRSDGAVLAREATTPSGVHHWPDLPSPWNADHASPPSPPSAVLAEVLVEDLLDRFLPMRLEWPPRHDRDDVPLVTCTLVSAPQRPAPPGAASIHALLVDAASQPAAWARVLATDAQGRSTQGGSDAAGRLSLHLPFPRPERRPPLSPPGGPASSPPEPPPAPSAGVTLRVFHDPSVGVEAADTATKLRIIAVGRLAAGRGSSDGLPGATVAHPVTGAPLLSAWLAQTEVRALARIDATDVLGPVRLEPGRPAVASTQGLSPNRSELRLAPL